MYLLIVQSLLGDQQDRLHNVSMSIARFGEPETRMRFAVMSPPFCGLQALLVVMRPKVGTVKT
jgi:hypothetical protein